jgi:endonuclease/exonuclease/phosphatase family metal-dependent hydrolase
METLRILSYNIHKGFTSGKIKFVLSQLRSTIQEVQADLVFLQEVIGHPTSQFEYLADQIWPHFAYGKNAVKTSSHHGNAILSKYPIKFWENIDVSSNRFEKRGILHGVIDFPHHKSKSIHLLCTHFALFESGREAQCDRLCERIYSHVPADAPLIIAGDFNDWRERISLTFKEKLGLEEVFLSEHGQHATTFPVWFPILKLDRVYCRGLKVTDSVCLSGGPWKTLSDHAALCVDFKI